MDSAWDKGKFECPCTMDMWHKADEKDTKNLFNGKHISKAVQYKDAKYCLEVPEKSGDT